MPDLTRLSKFLSYMLRHGADEFDLALDARGFTDLDEVRTLVNARYPGEYTEADLQTVVAGEGAGKKRFEIVGERIRALYGHSRVREITYPPAEPPDVLYHGTTQAALDAIRRTGLKAMDRQYVHLSTGVERAKSVGERHARNPVILRIRASEAHRAGVDFYHPEPAHFLVKALPAAFIDFPE